MLLDNSISNSRPQQLVGAFLMDIKIPAKIPGHTSNVFRISVFN